jgi:HSP20 family molecular chaperone IbpA
MHFNLHDFKSFLIDDLQAEQLGVNLNVPMDVAIGAESVQIWMDLPGVKADEVRVFRYEDYIVIEGVKQSHYPQDKDRVFVRMERQSAHFYRQLHVPVSETVADIQFELENGVLHIRWSR